MLKDAYPYYLANRAREPNRDLEVADKYSGRTATRVALADAGTVDEAIAAASAAAGPMGELPAYRRRDVLDHCVAAFKRRSEELALAVCIEVGKPIKDARMEVGRLIETFRIAAEESTRNYGEVTPLDLSERTAAYSGMWRRVPIGPCSFISPFNFPLNLPAHKVAPAIACGCPFVLKPASVAPVGALLIGEILAETDLPSGAFSILPCRRDDAGAFAEDERLRLLSFTGSPEVGWRLKSRAGRKKVVLELGGNAAVVIDSDCDMEDAVARVTFGAFYQSGQSCISVQRVIVHEKVYAEFRRRMVAATEALVAGDPRREDTFIGPMISTAEAERLESWIQEALDGGASLLCGGRRVGSMLEPALIEGAGPKDKVLCREAFGPVAVLSRFTEIEEAFDTVNDSAFGLQAGVFTRDIYKAHRAWERLEVGGVIIGDVPSWRSDGMPYGGVKDSGLGREGVRFAIEDMTELRLMVIRRPPT